MHTLLLYFVLKGYATDCQSLSHQGEDHYWPTTFLYFISTSKMAKTDTSRVEIKHKPISL